MIKNNILYINAYVCMFLFTVCVFAPYVQMSTRVSIYAYISEFMFINIVFISLDYPSC